MNKVSTPFFFDFVCQLPEEIRIETGNQGNDCTTANGDGSFTGSDDDQFLL